MKQKQQRYEQIKIDELRPYEKNARTHSDEQVKQIQASIREFGFINPVLIDGNKNIIAGHGRILAAKAEGMAEVPCLYIEHLTEEQKRAYIIADNKLALNAGWDMEVLFLELQELKEMNFDISLTGFSDKEFELIAADIEEKTTEDVVPDTPEKPITKNGDVWLLGFHRVMCGDATVITDVQKLTGGNLVDMVFTDPPYNVDYVGKTKDSLKIQNDKMDNNAFYDFLYDSFVNMFNATADGGAIYICHADSEGINFRTAMVNSGWLMKQCLIWVKNSIVMGRQDYHWKHEPILYGWKPGEAHKWNGSRKQPTVIEDFASVVMHEAGEGTDITFTIGIQTITINVPSYKVVMVCNDDETSIWRIEKPSRSGEHPTMKPIAIPARAIKNSCKHGGIVLDLFGGSGSTLIACEQLNRICYTMELDPKYCDVIIKRWENLTSQKAKLING